MSGADAQGISAPASPVAAQPSSTSRWAAPIGAGLALAGLTVLAVALTIWLGRALGSAYDFHAYYDAALRLVATGTPYQPETLSGPFRPGPYGLYLYSPPLAILFVPLTLLAEQPAVIVWLGLRMGILALTCALLPAPRAIRLASFGIAALSAPFLVDLNLGNVSLIVTFFAVVVWRWLDRPLGSIALAAALALRPTMVVVCGWWLLRGKWRPVAWTVAAGVAIFLATLPFVGLDRWLEYLTVLRNISDVTGVYRNFDLGSSVVLLGGPAWLAALTLLAGYAAAAAAIVISLRRDRELSYVVTVMAAVLLAPLLWDHYLTMLLLPAAFLAVRGRPWGLLLPLLTWLPIAAAAWAPHLGGVAEIILPCVALAGMLLPFAAAPRGEQAGTFLDLLPGRRRQLDAQGAGSSLT